MKQVAIIGGGAAGMLAAISAKRNGASVVIYEHTDRIGKKILATGNGKCNFSNENMFLEAYYSGNMKLVETVLSKFSVDSTTKFFQELGMEVKNKGGYLYPVSEQASTVLDLLRYEIESQEIKVLLNTNVLRVIPLKEEQKWCIDSNLGKYKYDAVIIATGGKASPKTGSDGSGYQYAKKLGHTIVKPLPSLVQLIGAGNYFKSIAGVRIEAKVQLVINDKLAKEEYGEVQLTDYGVSGIPIFQISHEATRALDQAKDVIVKLDLIPYLKQEELNLYIRNRIENNSKKTVEQFFTGIMNKKIIWMMLKKHKIAMESRITSIPIDKLAQIFYELKSWSVLIIGTKSFDMAQVCQGGVSAAEINDNLESKCHAGLYFAGEVIDVDGICGGYNLQWAWSSGFVAGKQASLE